MPCLYVLNKIDSISIEELDLIDKVRAGGHDILVDRTPPSLTPHIMILPCQVPHYVPVSAHHEWNFDELLEKMWEYCKMLRM